MKTKNITTGKNVSSKATSGNTHQVTTGVAIHGEIISISFAETTEVKFFELSRRTDRCLCGNWRFLDKAGAYGIQTYGWIICRKYPGRL